MFGALVLAAAAHVAPLNVVVLFTDDHRRTAVGALGIEPVKTPNIDTLYRDGTGFSNCSTMGGPHGALCVPSRAMLMTGRNLWHLGPRDPKTGAVDVGQVREEFTTWPEVFRAHGYQTFFTGKWHNNKDAVNRLFTDGAALFFGGMHAYETNGHFEPRIHDFDPTSAYPESDRHEVEAYSSELYANGAIEFLARRRDKSKPFAMYVAFTAPHDPRKAPPEWHAMYPPEKIELPPNFMPQHPFDNGDMKVRDEMLSPVPRTEARTRQDIADYYAMVSEVDAQIGRILDTLKREGLEQNTLVVLIGDNGLAVGQHGLLGKQSAYEHSMGVPLVFRGPGIPEGQMRSALVYHHDVAATLLEMAGMPRPKTMEAKSLVPVLTDPARVHRPVMVNCYQNRQRAVHIGDWKLIRYSVHGVEHAQLFNLAEDPWETKSLLGQPGSFARYRELNDALRDWMREQDDPGYDQFFEKAINRGSNGRSKPPRSAVSRARS
ncbi:MAG: sulfatase-like hydrolase/transferase [Chthonomonadaceae bacterium]|nr:sulfatase-like hydrolase/transferase [Chthonomonadaceae bacterium]